MIGLGVWKMKYSIVKTLDRVQRKSKIIMKPRYNEIERKIIATGNYSYADKLKMDLALKRFQKEFMKTFLGRLIKKLVEWLGRLLA